jgi:3-oxoacyl-[acyl-carrier protein] reductase
MTDAAKFKNTVIISGGTKGLGRELSRTFSNQGYYVVALYRSDGFAAESLQQELNGLAGGGRTLAYDVSSGTESDELSSIAEVVGAEKLIVIHNACAAFTPKPMHLNTPEDFRREFDIAAIGAWNLYHSLIRVLLKMKSGTFISVLSHALADPVPKGFSSYLVGKSALQGFTRALAAEYSARGLKVFSVSPGFMHTSLTQNWGEGLKSQLPMEPKEVAQRIFTLSESPETPGVGEDHLCPRP